MRNSATHNGKDLAKEIALLKAQLEDLAETVNGTGNSIVERGGEALEETLRSARELIAKYGDTAKSIAHDAAKLKDKATRHADRAYRGAAVHHAGRHRRHRLPRRLALSSQLSGRQANAGFSGSSPAAVPARAPMIGPLLRVAASAAAARSLAPGRP